MKVEQADASFNKSPTVSPMMQDALEATRYDNYDVSRAANPDLAPDRGFFGNIWAGISGQTGRDLAEKQEQKNEQFRILQIEQNDPTYNPDRYGQTVPEQKPPIVNVAVPTAAPVFVPPPPVTIENIVEASQVEVPSTTIHVPQQAAPELPIINLPQQAAPELPAIHVPQQAVPELPAIHVPQQVAPAPPTINLPQQASP